METKAFSFTHRTKVFADGTVRKNNVVTPGELAGSAGGSAGSKPISGSEVASGALSVVGQPNSTKKRGEEVPVMGMERRAEETEPRLNGLQCGRVVI